MTTKIQQPASSSTSYFSFPRTLRLSSFQIGSAMGEILTASIWNRVMISDLGMPATPVGLLLALQYILIPISIWAGHRSDTVKLWGRRRSSYIWLGRGIMLFAFPLLGVSIGRIEANQLVSGWAIATIAFLLFGAGKLLSGSVFLALVRESAPPEKRGLAISITETVLITMFPIVAIGFGRWMETYDPATFWQMIIGTTASAAFFWWFAVVRVENQVEQVAQPVQSAKTNLRQTMNAVWGDASTRQFFIFLALATFAAWMQDNIMEPFGGDVFNLPAGETTRFTGYWAGTTVVVLLILFRVRRNQPPESQGPIASLGLLIMSIGMILLGIVSFASLERLLTLALVVFGGGFGLYTFGGLSLMAVMSPSKTAGTYLGLWTICILVSKGLGTFFGGALLDIFSALTGSPPLTYGLIFVIAAAGLGFAAQLVRQINFPQFASLHNQ
ncbi:MAG: BCD family MFS transporter [Candidatus Promineifilaceae bacterium]